MGVLYDSKRRHNSTHRFILKLTHTHTQRERERQAQVASQATEAKQGTLRYVTFNDILATDTKLRAGPPKNRCTKNTTTTKPGACEP